MSKIDIQNLSFTYPGAALPTLKNITLNVEKGDFLAVIGNNGCGKSTLCKVLNGLIPHFISGTMEGSVQIDNMNTLESDVGSLAQKVGYVYQDFENQIVRPTVLDDASYACMNYAYPDYLDKGREALIRCGLEGKETEYTWQLSGGQTHLLALAGAVSLSPDILILDEPIAQLDPAHADKIYEVLKELNEKYGKTIIVIEHHTEYIADYCKNVLLLKDGHIEWKLPVKEALQRVDELESCNIFPPQVTLAAYHLKEQGILPQNMVLPITLDEGKKTFKQLEYQCFPSDNYTSKEKQTEQIAASFQNVQISYKAVKGDDFTLFRNLNLDIKKGEKIALIGSNGAGKSTLMKLMIGLIRPSKGDVILNGLSVQDTKKEALSKQISLVYQNPEEMFIKDSIRADIAYAMKVRGDEKWEIHTQELLNRFRLIGLEERDGRLLSGGQMRRASLAIGVALNPEILLLDEPTANLDIATRKEIMCTLKDMKEITETVVIATHDMQLVCDFADRIIVLCKGEVIADGTREEIFRNEEVKERAGIRPPDIFTMGQLLSEKAVCYTLKDFTNCFSANNAF